jgi:hypothetical protein
MITRIPPQEKLSGIMHQLHQLKKSKLGSNFIIESSPEDDVFKEIYDRSVDNLLHKPINIMLLEAIFSNFNFNFVKACPSEITIILLHSNKIREQYKNFLINKEHLPTDDADLILKLLSQLDFKDDDLLQELKRNAYMRNIVDLVLSKKIYAENPGYYNMPDDKLSFLYSHNHIIEQIRLRAINQRIEYYSVALNHLLNEIHAICLILDKYTKKNPKDYDANDVADFLVKENVPTDICIVIRKLFDRRNTNQISHPGSTRGNVWAVTKDEYLRYREYVGQCLSCIL